MCYNQMCRKCDSNELESWAEIKIPEHEKRKAAKKLCRQLLMKYDFIKREVIDDSVINFVPKKKPHLSELCYACKVGECLMS